MKHHVLIHSIAALLVALPFSRADEKNAEEKNEANKVEKAEKSEKKSSSSSSSFVSADGTATITIDINGKKETRTFKLGDANNKGFKVDQVGDGAKAGGAAGIGPNGTFTFTVPDKQAKHEKGPWLGIAMEPVQEVVRAQLSLAPGEGIVINHVAPDGPAAKAGLQPNDILLRFEDQILVEPGQLKKLIAMKKPGDSLKLTFLRKGERKDVTVTLIEHEIEPGDGGPMRFFQGGMGTLNLDHIPMPGMENRLERLQDQLRQLKEKHPGVVVDKREWMSGSPERLFKLKFENLQRVLEESKLPKEQIERIRKELEHAQHEASEAMERAKRDSDEAVKKAERATDEAAKALNGAFKSLEKEKQGEQPK